MTDPDRLTPYEHTRQALHRTADRILAAWPHALRDAQARGYPSAGPGDTHSGDVADPTGNAACRPDYAAGWIAELGDVLIALDIRSPYHPIGNRLHCACEELAEDWTVLTGEPFRARNRLIKRIINLANKAAIWWPTPPKRGQTIHGITVGERGNTVDTCGLCGDPAPTGRDETTGKTLNVVHDGRTLHRNCWYTLRATPIKPRSAA